MGSRDLGVEPAKVPVAEAVGTSAEAGRTEEPVTAAIESVTEPTLAWIWYAASGTRITDRLLEWPPDLFAITDVVLTRAEAFRYALSASDWPPSRFGDWAQVVAEAAISWSTHAEDRSKPVPDLVAAEWSYLRERADMPLERLASGGDPRFSEALLTLHAIADEACAGLGVALDSANSRGYLYRARGRELLARTGSLARISTRFLRVFPKIRTAPLARPAFSRYACVLGPGIDVRWHKMPARHRGTDLESEYATILLLPWPLTVRASDFHQVEGSVARKEKDPFGFFEFAPDEGLDLDLLDRVLLAARREAGSVDVVVLPEAAIEDREIADLEALLDAHGVVYLQAGVRQPIRQPDKFPDNWMHIGVNPALEKGRSLQSEGRQPWFHIRQNKHHRWMLDESQVDQYHLGSSLHPHIRWWEAMDVPRKAIHFVEVAEMVLVSLICQDLADQNDDIAQLIRSVGPTAVVTALLDGPQLATRWSARYASVLADDPGSAVLTLAPLGMVERSRPHGREASRVIALWKDPNQGVQEIAIEPGAHAILMTVIMDRATRYTADRRWPADNGTSCYGVAFSQVRAAAATSGRPPAVAAASVVPLLETDELTILTAWAEGVSEAVAHAPEGTDTLLAQARSGATWRAELGLSEPTPRLAEALESLGRSARVAAPPPGMTLFDALLMQASEDDPGEDRLDRLVRRALLSMLEERRTRANTG